MSNPLARDESGRPNLRAFENNGFWYGLPAGALIGVLIAGPHFYEWPVWESLVSIFGGGFGGGILGYAAVAMAYGSEASGANYVPSSNDEKYAVGTAEKRGNNDGSDGGCDDGGSGNGGGD